MRVTSSPRLFLFFSIHKWGFAVLCVVGGHPRGKNRKKNRYEISFFHSFDDDDDHDDDDDDARCRGGRGVDVVAVGDDVSHTCTGTWLSVRHRRRLRALRRWRDVLLRPDVC